jgi:hypothetical protein
VASSVRVEIEQPTRATEAAAFLQSRGYRINVVSAMVGPPDLLVRKPLLKSRQAFVRELLDTLGPWMTNQETETAFAIVSGNERYEFKDRRAVEIALAGSIR